MGYLNQNRKDAAATLIAELAELASFRDIDTAALCVRDLCQILEINTGTVSAHVSAELLGTPGFNI